MRKNMMWFVIGAIVGMIGISTLSARSIDGYGWSEQDVYQAIKLLERIADNTAK